MKISNLFFLIKNHIIFSNQSIYSQTLIELQLKVVFYKLIYNKNTNKFVFLNT